MRCSRIAIVPAPWRNLLKSLYLHSHKTVCFVCVGGTNALAFGRLLYIKPDDAIGYAMHFSRSANAVIRVYDGAGNVIETHEHKAISKSGARILRRKENFACVRIFNCGSTRKTGDFNVTASWRERTRN